MQGETSNGRVLKRSVKSIKVFPLSRGNPQLPALPGALSPFVLPNNSVPYFCPLGAWKKTKGCWGAPNLVPFFPLGGMETHHAKTKRKLYHNFLLKASWQPPSQSLAREGSKCERSCEDSKAAKARHVAVAQKTGIPKWVALVSGNKDQTPPG